MLTNVGIPEGCGDLQYEAVSRKNEWQPGLEFGS